jgi:hypothetical protein
MTDNNEVLFWYYCGWIVAHLNRGVELSTGENELKEAILKIYREANGMEFE